MTEFPCRYQGELNRRNQPCNSTFKTIALRRNHERQTHFLRWAADHPALMCPNWREKRECKDPFASSSDVVQHLQTCERDPAKKDELIRQFLFTNNLPYGTPAASCSNSVERKYLADVHYPKDDFNKPRHRTVPWYFNCQVGQGTIPNAKNHLKFKHDIDTDDDSISARCMLCVGLAQQKEWNSKEALRAHLGLEHGTLKQQYPNLWDQLLKELDNAVEKGPDGHPTHVKLGVQLASTAHNRIWDPSYISHQPVPNEEHSLQHLPLRFHSHARYHAHRLQQQAQLYTLV